MLFQVWGGTPVILPPPSHPRLRTFYAERWDRIKAPQSRLEQSVLKELRRSFAISRESSRLRCIFSLFCFGFLSMTDSIRLPAATVGGVQGSVHAVWRVYIPPPLWSEGENKTSFRCSEIFLLTWALNSFWLCVLTHGCLTDPVIFGHVLLNSDYHPRQACLQATSRILEDFTLKTWLFFFFPVTSSCRSSRLCHWGARFMCPSCVGDVTSAEIFKEQSLTCSQILIEAENQTVFLEHSGQLQDDSCS